MIYEICNFLLPLSESFSFCRLVNYISFRAIMSALTAVILVFLFSRHFILFVHRHCFLDQVRETGVRFGIRQERHSYDGRSSHNRGRSRFDGHLGQLAQPVHALLGCRDGLVRAARPLGRRVQGAVEKRGQGTFGTQRSCFCRGFSALFSPGFASGLTRPLEARLPRRSAFHFTNTRSSTSDHWLYGLFIFLFVIFVSNAVNITDGLDGLAITPSIFVVAVLGIFAYVEGNRIYSSYLYYPFLRGAGELTIFGAAFVGAGLGFLWYNAYPAQIFMGDTGSLAIGGTMAVMSVLLKQEMLFPLLGALFITEAISSQIQDKIGVKWIGRRIFFRAPLHHNLQHKGIAETKVVIRLWIVAGILALISLATLKLR